MQIASDASVTGNNDSVGIVIDEADYNKWTNVKVVNVGTCVTTPLANGNVNTQIFVNFGCENAYNTSNYAVTIGASSGNFVKYTAFIGGGIRAVSGKGLKLDATAQYTRINGLLIDSDLAPGLSISGDDTTVSGAQVLVASGNTDNLEITSTADNTVLTGNVVYDVSGTGDAVNCNASATDAVIVGNLMGGFSDNCTSTNSGNDTAM